MKSYELKENVGYRKKAYAIVYQEKNELSRIGLIDKEGYYNFMINGDLKEDETEDFFYNGNIDMSEPRFYPKQADMIKLIEMLEIEIIDHRENEMKLIEELAKERTSFFPYWLRKLFGAK